MSMMMISLAMAVATPTAKRKAKPRPRATVTKTVTPPPAPPAAVSVPSVIDFNSRLLEAHNRERVRLRQTPLAWSDKLAADARNWAGHLARTDSFEHAPDTPGGEDQGENLWMGTAKAYSAEDMVGAWIAERTLFKSGPFPNISKSGNWADVGHYSQLIWYNTKRVGCAVVSNRANDYLVCRYSPPGNWQGESPLGQGK
jgi:Cysteine-rich secretory protein family